MRRILFLALIALSVATTLSLVAQNPVSAQTLKVGSKAPSLDIQDWISDDNGKYPHIKNFTPGKVYVVEFWATWCGPCLKAMPHLAELQEKYADKVQFISVTDEPLSEVSALLAEDYPGEGKTFGQLTSTYCLTSDSDGSTYEQYMTAAGLNGIPNAFIVGPTGEIEWIGHPGAIDGILSKVASGTWDREAYYEAKRQKELLLTKIEAAIDAEDIEEAFRLSQNLDELSDPQQQMQIKFMQTQLAIRVGNDEAVQFFKDTAESLKDKEGAIAAMAWMIAEMKYEGGEPAPAMIQAAEELLSKRVKSLPTPNADRKMMKGAVMDILSHLYFIQGRLDDAIANQEAAVSLNNDAELTDFLKQLKQEKASQ